ncbi:hypothetical cytosolic protein [Syntrophus aciditrophicus SB]|uniref:Hypothetical cytosolic protein n=1 Tax=Syntrophus aciditrophicus (strain SB) TaxID=56780 RepID=Q2LSA0_SYNAS|nr:hypothetical cytosolic protein [Syntrophus aciditrophicus SB]
MRKDPPGDNLIQLSLYIVCNDFHEEKSTKKIRERSSLIKYTAASTWRPINLK